MSICLWSVLINDVGQREACTSALASLAGELVILRLIDRALETRDVRVKY